MTATLDNEITELRRANAELQQRFDEALAERDESLQRETATTEVLQVINSSPGDLMPVFDAMLEKATRLCDAGFGILWTYDDNSFRASALRNVPAPYAEFLARAPYRPDPRSAHGRIINGERLIQFVDVADAELYRSGDPLRRALVDLGRARSGLAVSLRNEKTLLGVFVIYRQEVSPFTDKQIALVENFAAQAVIAMENARLLTETREALEQQTATAEVLQVVNSSPDDLTPVFDAMLERALRLCDASFGVLSRIDGTDFSGIAVYGAPPELGEALRQPRQIIPDNAHYRLLHGENVVQIEDITAEEVYRAGNPARRALADIGGARTALWVALRKDDEALGAFVIYRREVRLFTDQQIALLQNFAAQAVIAMENARLITETREALEQQTATAEVLQVINSSPGDLTPVFEALLDKALTLCGGTFGIIRTYDGDSFHLGGMRGVPSEIAELIKQPVRPPFTGMVALERLVAGEPVVEIGDPRDLAGYRAGAPTIQAMVDRGGARTGLWVALRKESELLGFIWVYRQEIRPFTDRQIALLQNFANQAVIAIENARLINETREALEQQTIQKLRAV
jgi:GAF domain-containing protein